MGDRNEDALWGSEPEWNLTTSWPPYTPGKWEGEWFPGFKMIPPAGSEPSWFQRWVMRLVCGIKWRRTTPPTLKDRKP